MGYPTKVQLIHRQKGPEQWYVNFPTVLAQAMDFQKGETVEWTMADNGYLILGRHQVPAHPINIKKKLRPS